MAPRMTASEAILYRAAERLGLPVRRIRQEQYGTHLNGRPKCHYYADWRSPVNGYSTNFLGASIRKAEWSIRLIALRRAPHEEAPVGRS